MKKTLYVLLLVFIPIVFSNAQTGLVDYQWDYYGLNFKVPENSDILEESGTRFIVDNPELRVDIEAYDGAELDSDTIVEAIFMIAEDEGLIINDNTEVQEFSNNGLIGVSLEGDRSGDGIAIAVLLSTRSNKAVAVTVIYGHGLENVANDIINSFTMTK